MGNSTSSCCRAQAQPESRSSKDEIPAESLILSTDNIFATFDATSDEPKRFQIQVNTGNNNYQYCYLDTTNNGVGYFNPQNTVTFKNLSLMWLRWDVIDENDNQAFLFSNKVTNGANPNPPLGVPSTYVTQANQYAFGAYNLQVLGDGVKFYLEPKPMDNKKIAIFTYLNEEQVEANKYYLQFNDEASTIVAMTSSQLGSEASLYIFQWRSA